MVNSVGMLGELRKEDLEKALRNRERELDRLRVDGARILAIGEPLENPAGGVTRVFRVQTTDGEQALRIDYAYPAAVAVVMLDFLGRARIAPRVHGLLEGESLRALIAAHPRLAALPSPWPEYPLAPPVSALLLEIVEDGWNVLRTQKPSPTPAALHRWRHDRILEQVACIQDALTELDIQLLDPQFLISREGEVRLIDLEHSLFIDSEENYWAYGGIIEERYDPWPKSRAELRNDFVEQVRAELTRRLAGG